MKFRSKIELSLSNVNIFILRKKSVSFTKNRSNEIKKRSDKCYYFSTITLKA